MAPSGVGRAGPWRRSCACWAGSSVPGCSPCASQRGWRYLPLLALTVAFAAYGGHPESLVILLVVLAITVVVVVLSRGTGGGGSPSCGRPAGPPSASWRASLLAAPLLLPGLQAVKQSAASGRAGYGPAPLRLRGQPRGGRLRRVPDVAQLLLRRRELLRDGCVRGRHRSGPCGGGVDLPTGGTPSLSVWSSPRCSSPPRCGWRPWPISWTTFPGPS